MSRSYRKHPFGGITTATSEKWDKRHANRTLRHANKNRLRKGEEENFAHMREVSNVWGFGKDGKSYWPRPTGNPDYWDIRRAEREGIPVEQVMAEEMDRWKRFMRK